MPAGIAAAGACPAAGVGSAACFCLGANFQGPASLALYSAARCCLSDPRAPCLLHPPNKKTSHHGLCLQLQQFIVIDVITTHTLLLLLSCGLAGDAMLLLVLLLATLCITGLLLLLWWLGVHQVWQLGPHVLQLDLHSARQMNRP